MIQQAAINKLIDDLLQNKMARVPGRVSVNARNNTAIKN
jgi:hypothetical protein